MNPVYLSAGSSSPILPLHFSFPFPMPSKSRASVQVLVRCRPFNAREEAEGEKGCTQVMQVQGNTVRMFNPKKDMEAVREEFVFDHCFDSTRNGRNDQQIDVYQKLGPQILDNCTSGYNACLFAYGQTGICSVNLGPSGLKRWMYLLLHLCVR